MFLIIYMASRPPSIVRSGFFNDKILHFLAYGLLTLLLYIPIRYNLNIKAIYYSIITFILTVSFGLTDEINQAFIPIRTFDLRDLLADAIGSIVMLILINIILRYSKN